MIDPSSRRKSTSIRPSAVEAKSSREPVVRGSSELELSDDDFVLLEDSHPISRSVLRTALAAARPPSTRAVAADSQSAARPQTMRETTKLERAAASSSWDEQVAIMDACLGAIAAETSRVAADTPRVAAELDVDDDEDTLPWVKRPPVLVAASEGAPAPFVHTRAADAKPLATEGALRDASPGNASRPVAPETTSEPPEVVSSRPHAAWLLASAVAGALGAIVGMQALDPPAAPRPVVSRATIESAAVRAPARSSAGAAKSAERPRAVFIGPPPPPIGPPPPPRAPASSSASAAPSVSARTAPTARAREAPSASARTSATARPHEAPSAPARTSPPERRAPARAPKEAKLRRSAR